jgi:hypothetical protein
LFSELSVVLVDTTTLYFEGRGHAPPSRRPRQINHRRVAQRVASHRSNRSDCRRTPAHQISKKRARSSRHIMHNYG